MSGLSTLPPHPPLSRPRSEEEEEEGVRNLNAQAAQRTKFLSPSSSTHGGGAAQIVSLIGASAHPPPPTTTKKELGYGLGGGAAAAAAKIPGSPTEGGSLVSGVVGSDIGSDFACVCGGDESVLSGAGDLEEDKSPVYSGGFDFDLGPRPFGKFNKSSRSRKSADRGAETPAVRGDCYKMASSNSNSGGGFSKVKSPPPAFRPPPPFSPPPAAPSPVAGAAAASSPLAQRKLSAALNNNSSNSGSSSSSNKRPVERLEGDKITRFGEPGIIHF